MVRKLGRYAIGLAVMGLAIPGVAWAAEKAVAAAGCSACRVAASVRDGRRPGSGGKLFRIARRAASRPARGTLDS